MGRWCLLLDPLRDYPAWCQSSGPASCQRFSRTTGRDHYTASFWVPYVRLRCIQVIRPSTCKPNRVKPGCYGLLFFVAVQPFMYGQARDVVRYMPSACAWPLPPFPTHTPFPSCTLLPSLLSPHFLLSSLPGHRHHMPPDESAGVHFHGLQARGGCRVPRKKSRLWRYQSSVIPPEVRGSCKLRHRPGGGQRL